MPNEKPLISAARSKFGKTLLGGFQVVYLCPGCNQELTSKDDAILADDTCPSCKTTFGFDPTITQAFTSFITEKRDRDAKRLAAEAEKETRRREKQAADAKAFSQAEAENEKKRTEQKEKDALAEERARIQDARDIRGAYGCLNVILIVGVITVLLSALSSLVAFERSNTDGGQLAFSLFGFSISLALSLTLVYVFFSTLKAIHGVLVLILDRLESSSD